MSGLKIWEFADTLQALCDTLQGAEDPAVIAEIEKAMETQLSNIAQKTDGVYEFLSRSESEARRLGEEIKRLQARKNATESRSKWVSGEVMAFLKVNNLPELKGDLHRLVRVQNPEALDITDGGSIPACYLTIVPASIEIDNAAVKKALKNGVIVPGAELTRGERISRS